MLKSLKRMMCLLPTLTCLYFMSAWSVWYFWYGYRGHIFFDGVLFGLFSPFNQTEYAESYSDKKLSKISIGMSISDVKKQLGNPLSYFSQNDVLAFEYSCYRLSKNWCSSVDGYFHQRRIIFDTKGKVVEVIKDYWID